MKPLTNVVEIPHPDTYVDIPNPEPIKTQPIHWTVLTEKDVIESGQSFIALTPKDYENLSVTMADILRWVKEAQWRLNYYQASEKKE